MVIRENLPSTLGNEVRIELGRSCTQGNLGKEKVYSTGMLLSVSHQLLNSKGKKKGKLTWINKQEDKAWDGKEILYFSVIGHTFTIFLPIAKVLHSITSEIYILLSVCINDLSVKQKLESKSFLENIIHLSSPNSIPGNSK